MNTWSSNIFVIVFIGQILITSWVIPRMILARMARVLERCPPQTHPKLYPRPVEYYRIGQVAFRWANHLILGLGFVVLFGAIALDAGSATDDGYISEAWPMAFGLIQFLPLIALELAGLSQYRKMRQQNQTSQRTAELSPRRLFDHVSPALVALAAFMILAVLGIDLYVNDFSLSWGSDVVQRDIVLLVTNLFLAAQGAWFVYGRKLDPHQTRKDRSRQVSVQLKSTLYISIAMSLFFMSQSADDAFDLDYLDAIMVSLYFQIIVLASIGQTLHTMRCEDIDFDVYREHPPVLPSNGH